MKVICCLLFSLLLPSCVYYGTSYEIDNSAKSACSKGTAKENKKCRAELNKLKELLEK